MKDRSSKCVEFNIIHDWGIKRWLLEPSFQKLGKMVEEPPTHHFDRAAIKFSPGACSCRQHRCFFFCFFYPTYHFDHFVSFLSWCILNLRDLIFYYKYHVWLVVKVSRLIHSFWGNVICGGVWVSCMYTPRAVGQNMKKNMLKKQMSRKIVCKKNLKLAPRYSNV